MFAYLNLHIGNEREKDEAVLRLVALPVVLMVLTGCVHLTRQWYGLVLTSVGVSWDLFVKTFGIPWLRPHRKPPDKRRTKTKTAKTVLLAGLAAAAKASFTCAPILSCSAQHMMDSLPRDQYGYLLTNGMSEVDAAMVRSALSQMPNGLTDEDDGAIRLILDTGCSSFSSGVKSDFENLRELEHPVTMHGISGGLKITHVGDFLCEALNDDNELVKIEVTGYYHPALGQTRLFSPQDFFRLSRLAGYSQFDETKMVLTERRCYLELPGAGRLSAHFDSR